MIRRVRYTAAAAAMALLIAGCGSNETPVTEADPAASTAAEEPTDAAADETAASDVPPLEEVWPAVMGQAQNAESVTGSMSAVEDGQTFDVEVSGQLDDSNYQINGTIEGMEFSVIAADGTTYLRGDEGFLGTSGLPNPAELAGTWIAIPEGMGSGGSLSLSQLWQDAWEDFTFPVEDLETAEAELVDLDGVQAHYYRTAAEDAEIWIDAETGYLLQVHVSDSTGNLDNKATMHFTDWDAVAPIPAPSDAVPMEELIGG